MDVRSKITLITRREFLHASGAVAGGSLLAYWFPGILTASALAQQAEADPLAAARAQMGAAPIDAMKLSDNLTLLSGPGGNVVVLNGPDGKIVVDTFVQPAWTRLKQMLDGMGNAPVKVLIDTHWHFDHTDNNQSFRQAGAGILAHENTRKRLTETNNVMGMRFSPAPAGALPTQTFKDTQSLQANGENIEAGYIQPAHTDTDIYVRYTKANVLHLGDVFFNGMYPFIDSSTGGNINGMIAGSDRALKMVDGSTKIVPGHGPLGDRGALVKTRDMLVTVRDRIQKLKSSGRSLEQVVAAKPTADLDPVWGKGFLQPNDFIAIVYGTL